MDLDLLGDILASFTFREFNIADFQLRSPWSISTEGFAPAFNLILLQGHCAIRLPDGQSLTLEAGQSILLPRGGDITYASSLSLTPAKLTEVWDHEHFQDLSDAPAEFFEKSWGGGGESCRFLGFAFELDETAEEQILPLLPDVITLTNPEATTRLVHALRSYLATSKALEPGAFATRARFAEGLVIDQVRRHILSSPAETGLIAGVRHRKLQKALGLMHKRYADAWSVESLARECGMSRASFAAQFRAVLGQTPMAYLNDWRVRKAEKLLTESPLALSEIAYRVGFPTEIAFRRNVRRVLGQTPRDVRSGAARVGLPKA